MTFYEFITEGWLWIQEFAHHLRIEESIEAVRSHMNDARDRVVAWWSYGRRLAFWGMMAVLVLNLAGFILGWIFDTGIFNAIVGLIIAPIILIMLAWWAPLAGVIGMAAEIVNGRFKSALQGGAKWAEGWMKIALGILMWQLIITFFLSFVPYWKAPSRVPIIALSALLILLTSYSWGSSKRYQKIIRGTVITIFTFNTAFCFVPATAKAISARLDKLDSTIARAVNTGEIAQLVLPNAEASGTMMEIKVKILPTGNYVHLLEGGAMTGYIQTADVYTIESPDMEFDIITMQGRVVASLDKANWPPVGEPFKIVAINKQKLTIKVS